LRHSQDGGVAGVAGLGERVRAPPELGLDLDERLTDVLGRRGDAHDAAAAEQLGGARPILAVGGDHAVPHADR
jgi:hypothetical protein